MVNVDFIIAGQGLAGSLLALNLLKNGATIKVVDPLPEVSSSLIAAGIMHPITGRRMVKTWKADELIPFAKNIYNELCREFQRNFFHEAELIEVFTSVRQQNEWLSRSADASVNTYIKEFIPSGQLPLSLIAPLGGIAIRAAWLDVRNFVLTVREHLMHSDALINDEVEEGDISVTEKGVHWKNAEAKKIIFCNGYKSASSSYFSWLPFVPAKGETIDIYAPEFKCDKIISRSIYIIPAGNDVYKVGATFTWNDLEPVPTTEGRAYLCDHLKKAISCPFEVTAHHAAIRPANKDRRPFIGMHPSRHEVGIFNGLGTKGVLLAPWYAKEFSEFLCHGKTLDKEVSITRYLKNI